MTGDEIRGGLPIKADQPTILFLSSPVALPDPSVSGSAMIGNALLQVFNDAGWNACYSGFVKAERWLGADVIAERLDACGAAYGSYWFARRESPKADQARLAALIAELKPAVVYCFGHTAAALVAGIPGDFRTVATFYDPYHLAGVFKFLEDMRWSSWLNRLRVLRKVTQLWRRYRIFKNEELPAFSGVDVLIGHSANHAELYERLLKRKVLYFPNPLEAVDPVIPQPASGVPAFIMAGAVTSTVSRSGLGFLKRSILPHIRDDLSAGRFQIRIVGGGKLTANVADLAEVPGITVLGHVSHEQLLEEYARSVALLVPTPIPLGFRTRIMDAFRRKLPVIAHSANQAGFAQLRNRGNCLMTDDGAEYAAFMREMLAHPELGRTLAAKAFAEFEAEYSATIFRDFVIDQYKKITS